ncbi:hypothetical protein CTAYLR_007066 [Chrysophaeum taylorii]|uniref:EamA domain-containing protein n=1 Tax=Chrysophaeum taylorii TaxID=2483200 RepID=A0AAD7UMJ0_9STRA|nr:hypothetical protein CTAYLR_007066 [Chrysophaeum taylorii]
MKGGGAWAALFVVQLSYCVWHVLGKAALNGGMSPFVLALYRQGGACLCMVFLSRVVDGRGEVRRLRSLPRYELFRVAVLGFLGFGNIFGFIVALSYVTSFNSALLHPIIPVVSFAAAAASGVEKLDLRRGFGVLLSAGGALVVVVFGVSEDHDSEGGSKTSRRDVFIGNAYLLGQCVCMGVLLVLQKSLLRTTGIPPTTLTLVYNVIAAALSGVCTLSSVGFEKRVYEFHRWIEVVATLYGAIFGICLIYVLLGWATHRAGPTLVSLSMTLQGPLNALLACIFLGRRSFTVGEVGGGALIALGLAVTVIASPFAKTAMPSPPFRREEVEEEVRAFSPPTSNDRAALEYHHAQIAPPSALLLPSNAGGPRKGTSALV